MIHSKVLSGRYFDEFEVSDAALRFSRISLATAAEPIEILPLNVLSPLKAYN